MRASLAGRWAAKESVFKAMKVPGKGAGASLKEIEIVNSEAGPSVKLSGEAQKAADGKGIKSFELSISHTDDVAVAVSVARP